MKEFEAENFQCVDVGLSMRVVTDASLRSNRRTSTCDISC